LLFKRLRVPLPLVHGLLRGAKIASNPRRFRADHLNATPVIEGLAPEVRVSGALGYRIVEPDTLPGLDAVVARCQELGREARARDSASDLQRNPKKPFLRSILAGNEFVAHPDLVEFMLSHPVLDVATAYLGSVPLLAGANLWWSPVNESARSSQLFHIDAEDFRQLKLFINIEETREDQGPLVFLPADISRNVLRKVGYRKRRIPDALVEQTAGKDATVTFVGPAGSSVFVDTARCLHYGSRENRRDRLVLSIQFLRFQAPCEATIPLRVSPNQLPFPLDSLQRLALGWA
jgi:hypothetical protein